MDERGVNEVERGGLEGGGGGAIDCHGQKLSKTPIEFIANVYTRPPRFTNAAPLNSSTPNSQY